MMANDNENILHEIDGRKVSSLRTKKRWRKTVVAKMLNTTREVVSSFELGIARLTGQQLYELCQLFKIEPSYLLFGNDFSSQKRKQLAIEQEAKRKKRIEDKLNNPRPKKKKKKHVVRSISSKLVLSSGFESNRRRH